MPIYEYVCPNCKTKFELLRPMSQAGQQGEQRAARAKAQQGQADDQEGKMVELGDGKEAREVDFQRQGGCREEG